MRILFVIAHIGKGGGQAVQACNIIREISKNHECKLLTLRTKENVLKEPCETEYVGKLSFPYGIIQLYNRLKQIAQNYDIIQCFDINFSMPAAYLSGKKFFTRLGMNPYKEFLHRKLYLYYGLLKISLPKIMSRSVIIVNSKVLEQEFKKYNPNYIPNGYFLDSFKNRQSKIQLRRKLSLPENKVIVIFTGKIIPRKNLDIVFESIECIPQIHFVVIGKINEQHYGDKYYSSLVKKYAHLVNKYTFIDEINNEMVIDYLNAADIFVFPSKLEGAPNSMLEAMGCKLPVVCSNLKEHNAIISHKNNGLIFESKQHLTRLLRELAKNSALRKQLGKNAYNYVKKNHNIKDVAQQYIGLFKCEA